MKLTPKQHFLNSRISKSSLCAVGLSILAATSLSSCGESEPSETSSPNKEQATPTISPATPTAAPAPAPAAEPVAAKPTIAEAKAALADSLLTNIAPLICSYANQPAFNGPVRNMLEELEAYYLLLAEAEPSLERVQLAILTANARRDLGAALRAHSDYNRALTDLDAYVASTAETTETKRMRSDILNGQGFTLLAQNKATEALPYYKQQLEVDLAIYNEFSPKEGATSMPKSQAVELTSSITQLINTYRCLGECLVYSDDPEEAISTFNKGQKIALTLNNYKLQNDDAVLSYIKLMSARGDLASKLGQELEAGKHWNVAAQQSINLFKNSKNPKTKLAAQNIVKKLKPLLEEVKQKLLAEKEAQEAAAKTQS